MCTATYSLCRPVVEDFLIKFIKIEAFIGHGYGCKYAL
jgi:hypothetical protein